MSLKKFIQLQRRNRRVARRRIHLLQLSRHGVGRVEKQNVGVRVRVYHNIRRPLQSGISNQPSDARENVRRKGAAACSARKRGKMDTVQIGQVRR